MMIMQKKTNVTAPGLVVVLTYDGLCTFEFGIAVEVFGLSRPEFDFPWYKFQVVACEQMKVRAMGGITIEADAGLEALERARTIVIPGWRDKTEQPPEKLLAALVKAHARGARCLTICSGVFVLAAAGLLNGKRATTHWQHFSYLKEQYPEILVEEDVLYIDEGNIITSAGSAAGIDASLHLIRRDFDSKTANSVARRLVMSPHRDGGQAQYVAAPIYEHTGRSISEVMDWARAKLADPIGLGELAAQGNMSERTFLRRFNEAVGMTPVAWLQQERMYRARELLEMSDHSLADIAEQCSYRSLETFRAAFKRVVGTSPAAYRYRFTCGSL